jgi:hypothetical protein
MRKIIFHLEVGYAGMDATDNGLFSDNITDEELDQEAWERAVQHAESYGFYPYSYEQEYDEEYDDQEEDGDQYSDNIEGWWEDYDPEKHDGLVSGGGEWVWN